MCLLEEALEPDYMYPECPLWYSEFCNKVLEALVAEQRHCGSAVYNVSPIMSDHVPITLPQIPMHRRVRDISF